MQAVAPRVSARHVRLLGLAMACALGASLTGCVAYDDGGYAPGYGGGYSGGYYGGGVGIYAPVYYRDGYGHGGYHHHRQHDGGGHRAEPQHYRQERRYNQGG